MIFTSRQEIFRLFTTISTVCLLSGPVSGKEWGKFATPVTVDTVKKQTIAMTDWVAAEAIAMDDSRISAEITGKIQWLPEAGQHIAKGQLLAQLDTTDTELQIKQLLTRIRAAKTRLTFLEKEARRSQRLKQSGHVSITQLETTLQNRDIAAADHENAQAELAILQKKKEKTRILAPFDGLVMQRIKHPHEWAREGDILLHFSTTQRIEIRAYVPTRYLPALHIGSTIDYKNRSTIETGSIRRIIAAGSAQSHQAELRIAPTRTPAIPLTVGDVVQTAIPAHIPKEALTVPRDALVLRKDSIKVYKIGKDLSAIPVTVTTGVGNYSDIEVSGDLQVGDQVVTRGGERLRPGQTVKILNAPHSQQGNSQQGRQQAWPKP